jgi:7-cyano-7-deazaguanine tRNA-ribosyltransferase
MIEIQSKDLLARIAKFRTKSGVIETPAFLPVVHPTRVLIPPRQIFDNFGCKALITNSYLLLKSGNHGKIHDVLDFPGSIMTDSGAYQLLIYGEVSISPNQIIEFQENIESDIAVILDTPTGGHSSYKQAQITVDETLKRAKDSIPLRKDSKILWVGPVQGGTYPDLVQKSAQEISKQDFSIYAIGSPTQLMEQYKFDKLVELVMAAKRNLPLDKPVHLFGAGHPLIFPLIVAMGCDLFDSAAYALFARHDRLLSSTGTLRLAELYENFCTCPICSEYSISEIKRLDKSNRTRILAEHNLHVCFNEIIRIKQAIREGRLWRLIESRLSSHPALVDAMNQLIRHSPFIEELTPISKRKALFITSKWSLFQPEIVRHKTKITSFALPPSSRPGILLLAAPSTKPYRLSSDYLRIRQVLTEIIPNFETSFDTIFLSPNFGLVPIEICDVYPLAQHETSSIPPHFQVDELRSHLITFIANNNSYSVCIGIFPSSKSWKTLTRFWSRKLQKLSITSFFSHIDFENPRFSTIIKKLGKNVHTYI